MKALILVDHGSTVEEANALLEDVADKARAYQDSPFDIVEHCHMELCEPSIKECFSQMRRGRRERHNSPPVLPRTGKTFKIRHTQDGSGGSPEIFRK